MTWASVRPALVTLVEAVTPPASVRVASSRGRGSSFRHFPDGDDERLPSTRGFWIRLASMAVSGNTPINTAYRQHDVVTLSIAYHRDTNSQDLDDAIASDYGALVDALTQSTNWARSTSTIIAINPKAEQRYMTAEIEDVDGGRILRITLEVEHTV